MKKTGQYEHIALVFKILILISLDIKVTMYMIHVAAVSYNKSTEEPTLKVIVNTVCMPSDIWSSSIILCIIHIVKSIYVPTDTSSFKKYIKSNYTF